jgi:hypothetical protein
LPELAILRSKLDLHTVTIQRWTQRLHKEI